MNNEVATWTNAQLVAELRKKNINELICKEIEDSQYTGVDFVGETFVDDAFDEQTCAKLGIKKPFVSSVFVSSVEIRNRLDGEASHALG